MEMRKTRADFDALEPAARQHFLKNGGKVFDPPATPVGPAIADPSILTREEFNAMNAEGRMAAVREGRRIVNGHRVPATGA